MLPNPLHPAVVHFPVVLAFLLPIFAIGVWWAIARSRVTTRAWIIPLTLSGMLFVSAFVALRTGQGEEDKVEKAVAENLIKAHEEAAETFLIASGILLLVATAGMLGGRPGTLARGVASVGTLAMILLAFNVGKAGGELVYKHGAAAAYANASANPETGQGTQSEAGKAEKDDD